MGPLPHALVTMERRHRGSDVLVVALAWPHEDDPKYGIFTKRQVDSLEAAGLKCDVMFVRGFASTLAYPAAALKLLGFGLRRRRRYAIVHGHGGEALLPLAFYRGGSRVITFIGDDLLGTPRADGDIPARARARAAVLRQLSRMTRATITQSAQMDRRLPRSVQQRAVILPIGVDSRVFHPFDRDAARAELGWRTDEPVALFAADPAVPRKRHWLAVAACEEAVRRGVNVRLQVASDESPDRMPLLMNAADCLLITSVIEGSPNIVHEALMCNLPVLGTPAGDVPELLGGVEPSRVCDADEVALGEALADMLRAPMRSNGRERSMWLDQRRIAERLLEIYDLVRNSKPMVRRAAR